MQKLEDFDKISDTSSVKHEKSGSMILSEHLAVNIPIIQFSLVNKSMH
jgi:hypothetical protein